MESQDIAGDSERMLRKQSHLGDRQCGVPDDVVSGRILIMRTGGRRKCKTHMKAMAFFQ